MTDTLDLGRWCILRCAAVSTLRLAETLSDAGFEAWAPIEKRLALMPRTKAPFEKRKALLPTYVFVPVDHINALLRLALEPHSRHPKFTVFRHKGGIPLIAGDQLSALRGEESRKSRIFEKWRRRGSKAARIEPGTFIKLPDGPFAGYTGIVEDTQGQFTVVATAIFGKVVTLKVASLLLTENMAQGELPRQNAA